MATHCTEKDCDWKGKKGGLAIHLAKAHDIHPEHEDNMKALESIPVTDLNEPLIEDLIDRVGNLE